MPITSLPRLSLLAPALVALWGCDQPMPVGMGAIDKAVVFAGGKDAVVGLKSETVVAAGARFEPSQNKKPEDPPVPLGDFGYTMQYDVAGDRLGIEWQRTSLVQTPLMYQEVIKGEIGYFNGRDAIAAMADQSAMLSARVAAVRKHQRLFLPHLLLRKALSEPQSVSAMADTTVMGSAHHVVALSDRFQPVKLYINAQSGAIAKVETMEDDPVWGDSPVEVTFADWKVVGSLNLPHKLTLSLRGVVVHQETRSAVTVNAALDEAKLAIPAMFQGAADAGQLARGEALSEYLHRFAALGFPADFDQSLKVDSQMLGAGAFYLTGGSAHTLAVEVDGGVVVIEAPADDARSKAVLAKIKEVLPGKAITHVINTHHHDDHAGGLRTYVAEGATIVTAASNKAHFEKVFATAHTLRPDSLQLRPAQAKFQTVGTTAVEIGTGARKVRVLPITCTHADGMLLVFVTDIKHLFVADLYSPGFFPLGMVIPGAFGVGAKELYRALTLDLLLDVQGIVGAHGFGVATLLNLKGHAGL